MQKNHALFELSFELKHNLIALQANLENGQKVRLSLDTCAWPHVVQTDFAAAQHWLSGQFENSEGVAGSDSSERAMIPYKTST